ncbi:MAG TPA: DUF3828 domain-containing protein [Rhizomicrobium sp.]|nr:DUF3828 domain-containing protein [Rhizomicrobium sp.]
MKRIALVLPMLLLLASGAGAAQQTAKQFLDSIYSHYLGDASTTGKGIFLDKAADYRRYFTKDLAEIMIADAEAAAKKGDVPTLDGDPFVDAQDWTITELSIHIDSQTEAKARATVHFKNFKEATTIRLDLARAPDGWRISDIFYKEGSLRGLYKKA